MRAWLALVVAGLAPVGAGGCNSVFGIDVTGLVPPDDASIRPDGDPRADIDRDGIKDIDDPCIGPDTDLLVDSDFDNIPNGQDPCPLDNRPQTDSDGDGIGDLCDPYPHAPGDRVRCILAFSDPDLDTLLWRNREEPPGWVLQLPRALNSTSPFGTAFAVSQHDAPAPLVTTVHAIVRSFSPHGRFALHARVGATVAEDVGCTVTPLASGWSVGTSAGGQVPSTFVPSTNVVTYAVAATFTATASTSLRCSAMFAARTEPVVAQDMVGLRPGTIGVTAGSRLNVEGIVIYERDDAIP